MSGCVAIVLLFLQWEEVLGSVHPSLLLRIKGNTMQCMSMHERLCLVYSEYTKDII